MLVMLREKGEISIHLIGTNGFYENTQNEMFIAVGLRVLGPLNLKISCRPLTDDVK